MSHEWCPPKNCVPRRVLMQMVRVMRGDKPVDGCTVAVQPWKRIQPVSIQIGRLAASSVLADRCDELNRCEEVEGAPSTSQRTFDPTFPLGTLVHQDNICIHDFTHDVHQRGCSYATLHWYCVPCQYKTLVTKQNSAECARRKSKSDASPG